MHFSYLIGVEGSHLISSFTPLLRRVFVCVTCFSFDTCIYICN